MTTLTQITQTVRKIIILILLTTVVGSSFLLIVSILKKAFVPVAKPPAPIITSPIFDKLPPAEFPQQLFPFDIKFSIETISGKLPEASPTAKVFFLPKKQQGLLTNIKAIQDAKKLGFTHQPQIIDKKFIFKEENKEFIIDPITRNFSYTYNFLNDSSVFSDNKTLTKNEAISQALDFLNSIDAIPEDYDLQNIQTIFLTFNGSQFIPLGSQESEANATSVKVSLLRKKIDDLTVITPQYNEGNIYVIISKSLDKNKQIIKAERKHQEVSYDNFGVYPLKNINTAWNDFLKGNGYIVNPGNSTFTKRAVIRDGFLAYYDNPEKQSYLIPIYVFTGDNGFVGFTNAIADEWLK